MTNMKIENLITDDAILTEFGQRLARHRIELQLTQAEVAERAGISKRTLERVESGAAAQMSNIVRIFRVLELLPALDRLIPEIKQRPMDLLKLKGKTRQRVSSKRNTQLQQTWSWDDDK